MRTQEVLMGKDEFFRSFRENADNFICSLLPGISGHPQIQYSPGSPTYSLLFLSAMDTFPCMRSTDVPCLQVASSSRWATATCST
jgi:hypothetical protein